MANPRLSSAKIIQKILEDKVFFSDLKKQISENDLPFCNMLILTVLRHLTALQQILGSYLAKKIPNKHRIAQYLLWAAIAEILYMETAEYAVINETVKNIRDSSDKFFGGLANAILRKVCAQKNILRDTADKISPLPDTFLSILEEYDSEQIRQINKAVFAVPALDITTKENPRELAEKMNAQLLPNGSLRIRNASKVQTLPEYTSGQWWVQDVAAALPVAVMGEIRGKKVADLCAAPGGKTAQLAAKGAKVTAFDISAERMNTLRQNMLRLGFQNIKTYITDAIEYLHDASEQFDAVLLDAPCSATGTFRRHPEILHIKNRQDAIEQAELQKSLLELCANILKINGILVYSVCSICKLEGERQIDSFLHNNPRFKLLPITENEISAYGKWQNCLILPNGTIRTLPYYQNGMDSFFICKMQRII
ncbi:MAG: RsmB/NOP family class I SAM-dependent RNA methyltransferase [Alphaproteobacteria bacterium]|nr:RsmB/NOP family class I SAM-dependent RNA methyltransferase [Alphaproteobacteria bacterium]